MPLDEESEAILAARRRAGPPPVSTQTVAEVRAARQAWRVANEGEPVAVHSVEDIAVPAAHGAIPVRVYRPDAGAGRPAIVYFHGGGGVIGDLDHSGGLCRFLCREAGMVVVNVDYRLAPEHRFPAAA